MSITEEFNAMMAKNQAERDFLFSLLNYNKKYSIRKIQKTLARNSVKWTLQKIAVICNTLCRQELLQKIKKNKKTFFIKTLDK